MTIADLKNLILTLPDNTTITGMDITDFTTDKTVNYDIKSLEVYQECTGDEVTAKLIVTISSKE